MIANFRYAFPPSLILFLLIFSDCIEEWKISSEELQQRIEQYAEVVDTTLFSELTQVVGTPGSMVPERPDIHSPPPLHLPIPALSSLPPPSSTTTSTSHRLSRPVSAQSPPPPPPPPPPVSSNRPSSHLYPRSCSPPPPPRPTSPSIVSPSLPAVPMPMPLPIPTTTTTTTPQKSKMGGETMHSLAFGMQSVHSILDLLYHDRRRLIRMVESSFLEKFGLHVCVDCC